MLHNMPQILWSVIQCTCFVGGNPDSFWLSVSIGDAGAVITLVPSSVGGVILFFLCMLLGS